MCKGKYAKTTNYKPLALLLAMALLVGCAIGGTVAWLADKTGEVKNTFTTSNIDIDLAETKNDFKMVPGWTIEKDPVVTVEKGSEDCYLFVKVDKSTNLDSYIAYKLATDDTSTWTAGTGTGEGGNGIPTNVFYKKVTGMQSATGDRTIHLLLAGSFADPMGTPNDNTDDVTVTWADDHVATKPSVTKEMMEDIDGVDAQGKTDSDAAKAEVAARPTITFTAYASQLWKTNNPGSSATAEQIAAAQFTPAEAWKNCPKS